GQWIDYCFAEFSFEELTEKDIDRLSRWAAKCAALVPGCADHRYRLGAIECYRGLRASALDAFRKAAEIDRPSLHSREQEVDEYVRGVFASYALKGIESAKDKGLAWARFTAWAAYALSTGNFEVFKDLYRALNLAPSKGPTDHLSVEALELGLEGS